MAEKKRNFWWWIILILAILLVLNFVHNSNKFKDYTNCVEYCKSNLYCLSYDVQDQQGNYYTSNSNFESCRNTAFSCLDDCETEYGG